VGRYVHVRPEVVMFTADSAGDPKAVLRSRKNLEAQAENVPKPTPARSVPNGRVST